MLVYSNEPYKPDKLNKQVKAEIRKLFKEVMDDWLLQVNYFIEVGSLNHLQAEQKALQQYRGWSKRLEQLLADED